MIHRMLGGMIGLYHVVAPDEAHVRVLGNKKEVFMSRTFNGVQKKPSYWTVPFMTKLTKLPLTNIRIDVPDVKLNDSNMAKFVCDVVCFVSISDPILAAERTGITTEQVRYEGMETGIESLASDFQAIMESIGRTVSTKQTILEIYKDRSKLDAAVTAEVEKVFPQWGLELVDLEIKDIKDVPGSTIISDIEKKQASVINSEMRVVVAEQTKKAEISEAENKREAELVKAQAEETYRKRQIEKDRAIAIAEQDKIQKEQDQKLLANQKIIEAQRKLTVGTADVEREAVIKKAEAEKQRLTLTAEGNAAQIQTTGNAEASIIKAKKLADAEGTEKLALAQQKFNDAATNIELIKATRDVQLEYAKTQGKAYENANINIVAGSTQEVMSGGIFGSVKLGPKEGASINQMLEMNPQLKALAESFVASKTEEKKVK